MLDITDTPQVNPQNNRLNRTGFASSVWIIVTTVVIVLVLVAGVAFYFYGNKYPGNASETINSKNTNNTSASANLTNSNYLVPPGPM